MEVVVPRPIFFSDKSLTMPYLGVLIPLKVDCLLPQKVCVTFYLQTRIHGYVYVQDIFKREFSKAINKMQPSVTPV